MVSQTTVYCPIRPLPSVMLLSVCPSHSQVVLVDSGADANRMDVALARELSLDSFTLSKPMEATALDGWLLWRVTHHTTPVTISFLDEDSETLSFHLVRSHQHPLILGFPMVSSA